MRTTEEILSACAAIEATDRPCVATLEAQALARDARELLTEVAVLRDSTRNPAGVDPVAYREAHLRRQWEAACAAAEKERDDALTSAQAAHVERDRLRGALEDATNEAARLRKENAGLTELVASAIQASMARATPEQVAEIERLLASVPAVRTEGAPHGDDAEGTVRA